MFALNIKTAASSASAAPAANSGGAQWPTTVELDEDDSFNNTPSTDSSGEGGGDGRRTGARTTQPPSPETPIEFDHAPYPHCPIFIPSKGRSDLDRSTMAVLVRDLVPFVLIVELEEAEVYSAMLDRLVGQHFGFSGMTYAAGTDGATTAAGEESDASLGSSVASGLWEFPCACCLHGSAADETSASSSASSPSTPFATGLSADAMRALARRLSTVFHHGYVFTQPVSAATGTGTAGGETTNETADVGSAGARRRAAEFVLSDVDEVRALFKIEVLPESNRGVSYVRNYVLQVLVPRMMVDCGVDRTGNVEELCLCGPGEHNTLTPAALRMAGLEPEAYTALESKSETERYLDSRRANAATAAALGHSGVASSPHPAPPPRSSSSSPGVASRGTPRLLHGLFGFYWVLDDDIYGFYQSHSPTTKNKRVSTRAMLREVESRMRLLRRNADTASPPPPAVPPTGLQAPQPSSGSGGASGSAASPYVLGPQQQPHPYVFTCKEDAVQNNVIAGGRGRLPTLQNYNFYYTTACFSLEYNRFALETAPDTLSVNSYNNIACLFNYALLHNPPQMRFFPPGVPNVRRPEDALVGYLGHSMLWYRFAVREDYDFTLQLIARGLYTLRFRSLAFDVPQMMKVRGGMTDYYRNCHEDIRQQNDRFVLQWPAVAQHWVKGKKDNRRNDIRVRWDLLSPARARYPGAYLYLSTPLPQLQPQRLSDENTDSGTGTGTSSTGDWGSGGGTGTGSGGGDGGSWGSGFGTGTRTGSSGGSGGSGGDGTTVTASASAADTADAETRKRARPLTPPPAPTAAAAAARDWKGGYVVERWRDISRDEARQCAGLHALPNDEIHIGRTVAVVPPFFHQRPSVVRATIIERAVEPIDPHTGSGGHVRSEATETSDTAQSPSRVVWTAVAQDVRGMPFLHVEVCYEVPPDGTDKAAASIDQFFAKMNDDVGA
ncbi:hypothetical protein NESM_000044200 [Novymonas esmeraldas]|uniref:CCZ1/INTU/HSP4 first Longin domain-containing protein n=1 Tax=Novymonas esmeraldas TaxID=1808958 RepID=A0AAW0F288_9TRYP